MRFCRKKLLLFAPTCPICKVDPQPSPLSCQLSKIIQLKLGQNQFRIFSPNPWGTLYVAIKETLKAPDVVTEIFAKVPFLLIPVFGPMARDQ